MGRPKRYASDAERVRAYRERKKNLGGGEQPVARYAGKQVTGETGGFTEPTTTQAAVPVLAELDEKARREDPSEARESRTVDGNRALTVASKEEGADSRGGSRPSPQVLCKDLGGSGKSLTETRWQSSERGLVDAGGVSDEPTLAAGALPSKTLSATDVRLIALSGPSPKGVPDKEWAYAITRAIRARKYAEMFPRFVKPAEVKYQDPMWQWENEVRGRFGGIIGGSLSGTRGEGGRP